MGSAYCLRNSDTDDAVGGLAQLFEFTNEVAGTDGGCGGVVLHIIYPLKDILATDVDVIAVVLAVDNQSNG